MNEYALVWQGPSTPIIVRNPPENLEDIIGEWKKNGGGSLLTRWLDGAMVEADEAARNIDVADC